MKPILLETIDDYPKSGYGRITTATNQSVHEVLNGDYNFTFEMLVTDRLFSKLKEEMIVATSVSVKDTDFFYVKNISRKNPGTVTVTCNHVTMLTNENYVRGKLSIDGKSVKAVLSEMASGLDLPGQNLPYSTDLDKTIGKTDIVYTNNNPGQILVGETNSLVSVLDARLVRKNMSLKLTSKNTGRYIDLRRGKNIAGVSIDSNIDNLVTSIVPYYTVKAVEVKDNTLKDSTLTNTDGWTFKAVKEGGTVTVGDSDIKTYNDANSADTSRGLASKSVWRTDQRSKGDLVQYRVATDMWVNANDVTFNGEIGDVINFQSPTNANDWTIKEISSGIVSVGGYRAKIYNDGTSETNRVVEAGSSWRTDKQRTKDGIVQYRIATNQWLNANDVSFRGNIADNANSSSVSSPINTYGWTISRVNAGGVVTITSTFAKIYDDENVSQTNRAVAKDSQWATDQARSMNGATEYRIATNQWVNSLDLTFSGTLGSVISQPAVSKARMMMARMAVASVSTSSNAWTIHRVSNGVIKIGTNGSIYNDEGRLQTNRAVANGTSWATDRVRTNGYDSQYRIATDQWVSYLNNTFSGDINEVISEPKESGTNSSGWTIKSVTGVVHVGGFRAMVYDTQNRSEGRAVAGGSSWKTDQQRSKNGIVQYRISTNDWVNANDVTLEGSVGGTISAPSTPNPTNGWTVRSITDGVVTVGNTPIHVYMDDNTMITNRGLDKNTEWKTDQQRSRDGIYEYRVATNMWVLSTDVSFKGKLGEVIDGNPENSDEATPQSTEEHLQYGPEVYSPLISRYKLPHRKYVDYSSRVENIPDLIDVSSKYFVENPKIDEPTYTISIDVTKANQKRVVNAQVGDIARIYDPKYGITSDETIIERNFDPDLGINKTLKAGTLQQTIFRYLDKRIKDASQKTDAVKKQTTSDISEVQDNVASISDDVTEVKDNAIANKDETDQKINETDQKAQEEISRVKDTVSKTQADMTNFMNSGGNNKIRWIPSLAEATQMEITTPYGYWLLDDHGAGFHKSNGTVMTGLSADGRVYADSITGNSLTGTTITGGTISGGVINGVKITGSSLESTSYIRLDAGGSVTSVSSYGISTPSLTVNQIDGANLLQTSNLTVSDTATIRYLHISGNIAGNGSGLYLQGPVYVDGRQI